MLSCKTNFQTIFPYLIFQILIHLLALPNDSPVPSSPKYNLGISRLKFLTPETDRPRPKADQCKNTKTGH